METLEAEIAQLKDKLEEMEYLNESMIQQDAKLRKVIESGHRDNTELYNHSMELIERNEQLKAENAFLKMKIEIMGRNAIEKFQSLESTIASYKQGVMWDSKLPQEVEEVVP